MRGTTIVLFLVGLWLAFAPASWGWASFAQEHGEVRLVRFFLGCTVLLLGGLLVEKNRMRGHMKEILDALNRVVYGKDYAKHREAVDLLMTAAAGRSEDVRKKAFRSLKDLTGQAFGEDLAAWQVWWQQNRATFSLGKKKGK